MKEKYKRSMAKAKKKERRLVEMLSGQRREDPVTSTKFPDQDVVRRKALTPVATREAVSCKCYNQCFGKVLYHVNCSDKLK